MITNEEMERLRVQLTSISGLDALGLYLHTDDRDEGFATHIGEQGEDDDCDALYIQGVDGVRKLNPRRLFVNLADSSTRDRVARWVAGRVVVVHCTAPTWEARLARGDDRMEPTGEWALDGYPFDPDDVPALGDLDAADPRLLPDGSRWVDAAALAAVARHVGGTSG